MKLRSEETTIPVVRISQVWQKGVREKLPFGCNRVFLCLDQQLILVGRENFVFILLVYSEKKETHQNFSKMSLKLAETIHSTTWVRKKMQFSDEGIPFFCTLKRHYYL